MDHSSALFENIVEVHRILGLTSLVGCFGLLGYLLHRSGYHLNIFLYLPSPDGLQERVLIGALWTTSMEQEMLAVRKLPLELQLMIVANLSENLPSYVTPSSRDGGRKILSALRNSPGLYKEALKAYISNVEVAIDHTDYQDLFTDSFVGMHFHLFHKASISLFVLQSTTDYADIPVWCICKNATRSRISICPWCKSAIDQIHNYNDALLDIIDPELNTDLELRHLTFELYESDLYVGFICNCIQEYVLLCHKLRTLTLRIRRRVGQAPRLRSRPSPHRDIRRLKDKLQNFIRQPPTVEVVQTIHKGSLWTSGFRRHWNVFLDKGDEERVVFQVDRSKLRWSDSKKKKREARNLGRGLTRWDVLY